MSAHALVCSMDNGAPSALSGQALIAVTRRAEAVSKAKDLLPPNNQLSAVVLRSPLPLEAIEFQEDWAGVPLIVYAPAMGAFRTFSRRLDVLGRLPVEILLPVSEERSFRDLTVLSSLGLRCGIVFDGPEVPWDRVNDLMHFGLYTKLPHGPIQPFHYVAAHFRPDEPLDFNDVYFDNPARYLHVDASGRIALTAAEGERGIFITDGLDGLAGIAENENYLHRMRSWQEFFRSSSECSGCEGWRICLGKFASSLKNGCGCKTFFSDWLEAVEFQRKQMGERQGLPWPY